MKTSLFPVGTTGKRILPNGGNGAMIITKDPKKPVLLMVRYVCGRSGRYSNSSSGVRLHADA